MLTRAIFAEGCKAVAAGMNPMDLRRGILAAVDQVVINLQKMSRPIQTTGTFLLPFNVYGVSDAFIDEIAQVATISANGDAEIGQLIASAMEKVGKEGVITVQDGKTVKDELEVIEGMKIDSGFISHMFITDSKTSKVV